MDMRSGFKMLVAATAAAVELTAVGALPSGYTQLESIEVTASGQYINTKYGPTADTDIELKAELKDFNSLTSIYWTRSNASQIPSFALVIPNKTNVRAYKIDPGSSVEMIAYPDGQTLQDTMLTYSTSGRTFKLNDFEMNFPAKPLTADLTSTPIFLFSLNDNGGNNAGATVPGTKLYYFRIKEKGELVRSFVPCKRDADEAVGLYEIVQTYANPDEGFFANAGSGGSFKGNERKQQIPLTVKSATEEMGVPVPGYGVNEVAVGADVAAHFAEINEGENRLTGECCEMLGWELVITRENGTVVTRSSAEEGGNPKQCSYVPEIGDEAVLTWLWTNRYGAPALPDDYEPLDCLDVTDKYFVNTKYNLAPDDLFVEVCEVSTVEGTPCLFSARQSMDASLNRCVAFSVNGKWRFDYGTKYTETETAVPVLERVAVAVTNGEFAVNGAFVHRSEEVLSERLPYPLVLMASTVYADGPLDVCGVANIPVNGKIYTAKVWDKDGNPKVALWPCLKKSTGYQGLYDSVRQVFCPVRGNVKRTIKGSPANCGSVTPEYAKDEIIRVTDVNIDVNSATVKARAPSADWQDSTTGSAKFKVTGWKLTVSDGSGIEKVTTNEAGKETECDFLMHNGEAITLEWQYDTVFQKPFGRHTSERFIECEWMDFDGSAVVETDYVPAPDGERTELDCQATVNAQWCFYCARRSTSEAMYSLFWSPGGLIAQYDGAQATLSGSSDLFNERIRVLREENRMWVKGREESVLTVGTFSPEFTAAGGSMAFGASYSNPASRSYSNNATYRFHSFKVWNKGEGGKEVLVRWFVPCIDKLTGESGLYDVVTKAYYPVTWGTRKLEMGPQVLKRGIVIFFE